MKLTLTGFFMGSPEALITFAFPDSAIEKVHFAKDNFIMAHMVNGKVFVAKGGDIAFKDASGTDRTNAAVAGLWVQGGTI